jgi:hypothetical protein
MSKKPKKKDFVEAILRAIEWLEENRPHLRKYLEEVDSDASKKDGIYTVKIIVTVAGTPHEYILEVPQSRRSVITITKEP